MGLDATQRAVIQPILGFLQVLAAVLAVVTLVLVALRWSRASTGTAIAFASMLGGWLLLAGLTQGVPAAVYQATSVGPNEQTAQTNTINDYLTTSRYAWAIQDDGTEPTGAEPDLRPAPRPDALRPRVRSRDPAERAHPGPHPAAGHPRPDRPEPQLSDLLDDHRRSLPEPHEPAATSR